jgi:type VI secretion system protein ImpK
MQGDLGRQVYQVLRSGLILRARLQRGEEVALEAEQARLRTLLKSASESRQWPVYGGDGEFLGIRYALTCWLDELFLTGSSSWQQTWNENKLETVLYETNDRAWRFWDQAQMAEARGEQDALEAFYLCVMLGFRGKLMESPQAVQEWRKGVERQFGQEQASKWKGDIALPTQPPNVPPLRGHQRLRTVLLALLVTLGLTVLAGIFRLVSSLGAG